MKYNVSDVIRDVRVLMDENAVSAPVVESSLNTLSVDEIIGKCIEPAAQRVVAVAPLSFFKNASSNFVLHNGAVRVDKDDVPAVLQGKICEYVNDGKRCQFCVPENVMRLFAVQFDDEELPCYDVVDYTSPEYAKQLSKQGGIRGTKEHPMVVVHHAKEGIVASVYGAHEKDVLLILVAGVALPKIDNNEQIDVPEEAYQSLLYMTAGLASQTLGNQKSGTYKQIAEMFLGIETQQQTE